MKDLEVWSIWSITIHGMIRFRNQNYESRPNKICDNANKQDESLPSSVMKGKHAVNRT